MARLTTDKKAAALGGLLEGLSLRATSRPTGISRERLSRLILDMGRASERLLDERIRHFECDQLEADEQWMYIAERSAKLRAGDPNEYGDAWVWSAVDPDSKVIPADHVGKRQLADAHAFARRLKRRLAKRPQFNTDRLRAYRSAILGEFSTWDEETGTWDRPDWGTIVKRYQSPGIVEQGRYVPPRLAQSERRVESGNPDEAAISTSHVESHHLQFRMRNKRAARMTNGASKTLAHLRASTATYYAHYNFVRMHSSIRTTPAVAGGLDARKWSLPELVEWAEIHARA